MKLSKIVSLVGSLICVGAFAQLSPSAPMNVPVQDDWRYAQLQDAWHFTTGLGLSYRPTYLGASSSELRASPVLSATYGRYFLGGAGGTGSGGGLGLYIVTDERLRVGVSLGLGSSARKQSQDSHLYGLGDVASTERGNIFASYKMDWLTARTNLSTDIGGKGEGSTASFDLDARYRLDEKISLSAGTGLTWANTQNAQTFFGVSASQSANSGLARYSANAGVNQFRFSIGADYRLTPQWNLSSRLTSTTLTGSAASSPITQSKSQDSFSVSAAYRF
jgi:outer membrane protein